jgi:hypothetical protein
VFYGNFSDLQFFRPLNPDFPETFPLPSPPASAIFPHVIIRSDEGDFGLKSPFSGPSNLESGANRAFSGESALHFSLVFPPGR